MLPSAPPTPVAVANADNVLRLGSASSFDDTVAKTEDRSRPKAFAFSMQLIRPNSLRTPGSNYAGRQLRCSATRRSASSSYRPTPIPGSTGRCECSSSRMLRAMLGCLDRLLARSPIAIASKTDAQFKMAAKLSFPPRSRPPRRNDSHARRLCRRPCCRRADGSCHPCGATCMVAAVDELVSEGRARRAYALAEAALWVGGLSSIALMLHWLNMSLGIYRVTGWTVAGGVMLGIGA